MWWDKGPDKKPEASKDKPSGTPDATKIDPSRDATQFDPDKLPARRELPKTLQSIVDKSDRDENFFDELVDG